METSWVHCAGKSSYCPKRKEKSNTKMRRNLEKCQMVSKKGCEERDESRWRSIWRIICRVLSLRLTGWRGRGLCSYVLSMDVRRLSVSPTDLLKFVAPLGSGMDCSLMFVPGHFFRYASSSTYGFCVLFSFFPLLWFFFDITGLWASLTDTF